MNLSETITMSFSTKEVVLLDTFFRQTVSRLGNGTFRDEIQAIKDRFDRAVIESQLVGTTAQRGESF